MTTKTEPKKPAAPPERTPEELEAEAQAARDHEES